MAKGDIKAWITVNGRHIPIMEGESKTQALANHFRKLTKKKNEDFEQKRLNEFKSKSNELKNKYDSANGKNPVNEYNANAEADLYMKEKYGRKYWAMRQIKGINTDPDNKVKKAEAAYKKIYERNSKWINDFENEMKRSGVGQYSDDYIRSKYPNRDKSTIEHHKAEAAVKLSRLEADKFYKDRFYDSLEHMKTTREKDSLNAYMKELNKPATRYKLKEDNPKTETAEKIKITGRMKTAKEVAKEVKETAIKRMQDAQDKVLDKNYKRIHTYNKNLDKEFDKARKENTKDLEEKLGRAIKYQGFVEKNGTSHLKTYKSKELSKTVNQYRNLDNAFKLVYGTDRHGLRQGSEAYKKYLKEHPNSKMKLTTFLKNYDKKK